MIPSTARSTSTLAAALPEHLQPLLQSSLDNAKAALSKILPEVKKANVLEEAEYEEDSDAGFEKEKMIRSLCFSSLLAGLIVSQRSRTSECSSLA